MSMCKKDKFTLHAFISSRACLLVEQWVNKSPVRIVVVAPRKTKWGDYRKPGAGMPARITVNRDANPHRFLMVLTHELAHHMVFIRYGNTVRPHGLQWKNTFFQMLQDLNEHNVFPEKIRQALPQNASQLKASASGNRYLYRVLKTLDKPHLDIKPSVEELPANAVFKLPNGHAFKKMGKKRVRILCQSLKNKKYYLFSPDFEVDKQSLQ